MATKNLIHLFVSEVFKVLLLFRKFFEALFIDKAENGYYNNGIG